MTPKLLADRYEVGRLLGAGGMAQVYEGWDRMMTRRVAIKLMNAPLPPDPAALQRFQREAKAAASLSHPNIVSVYDAGAHDRTAFIVMELVEGYTLRDRLRFGPLPTAAVVEVTTQVCAALTAAHERGLVHRDVKPGNIMLTPTGRVKMMDFGIARGGASDTMTHSAMPLGTAQYLAPEQAEGAPVDARSDLYSLGCCLYEMLTGEVPFTGESPVGVALRHVREDPVPPSQLNDEIPPAVEQITLRALAKRPSERWQNAGELRAALERGDAGPAPAQARMTGTMAAHPPVSGEQTPVPFPPATSGPPTGSGRVRTPGPGRTGQTGPQPVGALSGPIGPPTGPGGAPTAVAPAPSRQAARDRARPPERRSAALTWKVAVVTLLFLVAATTGAAALLSGPDNAAPGPQDRVALQSGNDAQTTAPPTTTAQPAAVPAPDGAAGPAAIEASTTSTTTTTTGPPAATQAPGGQPPGQAEVDGAGAVAPGAAPAEGQINVPDLVGLTGDEARETVTGLGLQVNTVGIPTPIQRYVGQVIVQRPQPGTLIEPGGQVFLGIGVAEQ